MLSAYGKVEVEAKGEKTRVSSTLNLNLDLSLLLGGAALLNGLFEHPAGFLVHDR